MNVRRAWHGTAWRFRQFDPDKIGTGEANAQGAGFYFSEKRPGAEKIQRYLQFRENTDTSYVYHVKLSFNEDEMVDMDAPITDQTLGAQRNLGRAFSSNVKNAVDRYSLCGLYHKLREQIGDHEAADRLRSAGLVGFQMYEDDNNYHYGRTIVMLDESRISIISREQYIESTDRPGEWHYIETL